MCLRCEEPHDHVVDTFFIGGGFSADGYLIVSDQTFLRLFPQRQPGAPNHILVRLERALSPLRWWQRSGTSCRPTTPSCAPSMTRSGGSGIPDDAKASGLVFGFGIIIGVLVGMIIVYQVLSTDVADHIREYATFKAIGYPRGSFWALFSRRR